MCENKIIIIIIIIIINLAPINPEHLTIVKIKIIMYKIKLCILHYAQESKACFNG